MINRFGVVALLAALALALPASLVAAEGHFTRTLSVTGPVQLDVDTGSGDITVRSGESGRVTINGTITPNKHWLFASSEAEEAIRRLEENPPIEQSGNTIRIGHIEDRTISRNVSVSYQITVPPQTSVEAGTGSGDQRISGVAGPVKASSGSGNVAVSDIGDAVRAETGSGDIEVKGIQGELHASTGSGSIRGTAVGGALSASTGSGDVILEQSAPGDARVTTGSGDVELTGLRGAVRVRTGSGDVAVRGEPSGDWTLDTSSGDIMVQVPAGAAFDLEASTSSGSIDIGDDHPVTVRGRLSRHRIHGQVHGGGATLALSTSSGDIRIE